MSMREIDKHTQALRNGWNYIPFLNKLLVSWSRLIAVRLSNITMDQSVLVCISISANSACEALI